MKERAFRKIDKSDLIFNVINYIILGAVLLLVAYPLYFVVIASVSNPDAINTGEVTLFPVVFDLAGYQKIFQDARIMMAYGNTIFYTVVGTTLSIVLTMMFAYPLSRPEFFLRGPLTFFMMFTMYFSGGMIPTYLLMRQLGLYNTRAAVILLPVISVFNVIIARTNIRNNIPPELYEAASIDGCSHFRYFFRIVFPLSQSIISVLLLYYGVAYWNDYMNALIYLKDSDKYSLQLVLREILTATQAMANQTDNIESMVEQVKNAELIKYVAIVIASVPVIAIYPFLQKYFEKGVMVGSVKG